MLEKGKPPRQIPYDGPEAECYITPDFLRGKAEPEYARPSSNAVQVMDGETIVLWDGSNAGEVLKARKGILASTMMRVRHDCGYDTGYFYYALKGWEHYIRGQTAGSGIPHVDRELLGALSLFNCERREQTKIAEILSTVDQAIYETEAVIAKQELIMTGLMEDLLTARNRRARQHPLRTHPQIQGLAPWADSQAVGDKTALGISSNRSWKVHASTAQ